MKKLSKLNLNDAKIMDIYEMKAITGGQVALELCRNTNTNTGIGGGPANVTCGGECPTVQPPATGSTGVIVKKVCDMRRESLGVGNILYYCDCV